MGTIPHVRCKRLGFVATNEEVGMYGKARQ
jgi:hypothetical protein